MIGDALMPFIPGVQYQSDRLRRRALVLTPAVAFMFPSRELPQVADSKKLRDSNQAVLSDKLLIF